MYSYSEVHSGSCLPEMLEFYHLKYSTLQLFHAELSISTKLMLQSYSREAVANTINALLKRFGLTRQPNAIYSP